MGAALVAICRQLSFLHTLNIKFVKIERIYPPVFL